MATETQKKIESAQKKYDDLADKASKVGKDDKEFRAAMDAEVKQKLKARFGDREKIVKEKGDAHRELVALKQQREGEIVAAVDKGQLDQESAKAELIELGHTPESARIQIARATHEPIRIEAPSPTSEGAEAPLPPREIAPNLAGKTIKADDPISAKSPESQTVVYKDPASKPAGK